RFLDCIHAVLKEVGLNRNHFSPMLNQCGHWHGRCRLDSLMANIMENYSWLRKFFAALALTLMLSRAGWALMGVKTRPTTFRGGCLPGKWVHRVCSNSLIALV